MKTDVKQKKINISYCSSSACSMLRKCLVRFCLCSSTLLLFANSTPPAYGEQETASEKTIVAASETSTTETLKNSIAKEYWKSNIDAPEQSSKNSSDLLKAIRMLNKIEVKAAPAPKKNVAKTISQPTAENNAVTVNSEVVTTEPNIPDTQNDPVRNPASNKNGLINNEVFQKIKLLSKKPETAKNPFITAEILFKSQCPEEACIFYKEALRRNNADENVKDTNTAWILLQIGNCLRKTNKEEAMESYQQLIKEHPESEWLYLARTQEKLLSWQQVYTPNKLLKIKQ